MKTTTTTKKKAKKTPTKTTSAGRGRKTGASTKAVAKAKPAPTPRVPAVRSGRRRATHEFEADAIASGESYADARDSVGDGRSARGNGSPVEPDIFDRVDPGAPVLSDDDIVVFAFRITRGERELIHQAAGSMKASKLVRETALAAARRDLDALRQLVKSLGAKAR